MNKIILVLKRVIVVRKICSQEDIMLLRWLVGIAMIGVMANGVGATDLEFGGQIRPRTEFRDPVGNGYDVFTSMRARLNITASLEQDVNVFIQLQDVRLWGEESDTFTDYNADNFDFHQAYMDIKDMGDTALSLRIGRQAIGLGGQRLSRRLFPNGRTAWAEWLGIYVWRQAGHNAGQRQPDPVV